MFEHDAEIVFNKKIAPHTYLIGLRSSEVVAAARPGQFVMLRVRSGIAPLLRRPFSIAGTKEGELLLILYRVVGKGTAIMAETREGERLSLLGPLGKGFELPKRNQASLLVAGGIGIAPLFFLIQDMNSRSVHLMTGFGSADEIIGIDQFGDFPIDVSIATDDGTAGHGGPVTDLVEAFLSNLTPNKHALSIFACGPEPMLKKVATMALDRGLLCQASLEAAMACGVGACQGCAIKASADEKRDYYHVCADGPVFPVTAIDWDSL
ncbi:MAG: dihydroorotate dehydrogenase electron transfer subunit [Desulfobacteraceae bacterium]|jgi:dihydroorotate dehydrogenase electron transfer subunit